MDLATWHLLGGAAFVCLIIAMLEPVEFSEIVFGLTGSVLWSLFAIGATNVEIYTEASSVVVTQNYTELVFVGALFAILSLGIALLGFETIVKRTLGGVNSNGGFSR